jgi:hypothetical protein
VKADNNKPRGFSSLSDAMRELQQRHAHQARGGAIADEPPPDQGEVALTCSAPRADRDREHGS